VARCTPRPGNLHSAHGWCCSTRANFDALVRHGIVIRDDLRLFHYAGDPATALGLLQATLTVEPEERIPAFASSRTPRDDRS
jgi:hypothetical protein